MIYKFLSLSCLYVTKYFLLQNKNICILLYFLFSIFIIIIYYISISLYYIISFFLILVLYLKIYQCNNIKIEIYKNININKSFFL